MKLKQKQGVNNPNVAILYDKVNLTMSFEKSDLKEVTSLARKIEEVQDKDIDIEVKVHREKRSLDANAYMWVLADKIADAVNSTKAEVYRKAIREVGVFYDMAVLESDVPKAIAVWESNGIGWFADEFDSKLQGCKRIRFYHGSSMYDTKQMSRLIDYIVEEAKEVGIDTKTPDEIERMKNLWDSK